MPAKPKSNPHLEIAHVLFIDAVGYSKLLVNEQRELVQQLNQVVRKTPQFRKSEAAGKLIRIPVGDGMALVFFQTPEEPVQCAMEIARALKNHPQIRLRMGVHSGPVDQLKDVNDRINVAGAGMNIAQRVMDCGDAGHILVSKRVADDLAQDRLWQPHLHELGEIEVKHGAKVAIFNVYTADLGNPNPPEKVGQQTPAAKSPAAESEEVSAVPEKSIAVLPFENLSTDPSNTFFADAIQDEILTDLSNIADLKVISRTSVMQYKTGVKRNLREIANELGVAHVVEGSVQPAGNRVRVRAQLIDARTDRHLWGERYDRPLDDVFAIQTDIAKAIADHLQAKLSQAEKAAMEQPPTTDLVAYDRYLRSKNLIGRMTFDSTSLESFREAIRLLDQAVARDPTFLLARCELAQAHGYIYFTGSDRSAARLALAKESLATALQLGPDRGEPHLAAAWLAYRLYRDYETALSELVIAQRKLPNDPEVFALPGFIARRQGDWEQCISNMERACELDPRNLWLLQQTAQTYWLLRRFPDMTRLLDRTLAVAPGDAATRLVVALIDLESRADAQPACNTARDILNQDPAAVDAIAEQWFYLALCSRNATETAHALASLSQEGIVPFSVRMPYSLCEGIAGRARGDAAAAERAFNATRIKMENQVREQPDYAAAFCLLGMSYAALGRKEDALREGRRAAELMPVTKDALTGAEILRNLAITYAWIGEKDLAIKQLEELLPLYCPISYGQLRLHPWWDPLRDDPRFEKIIEESKKPVAI
jgi:TolB-like protein/class 3 adenylate cyclase/Tfp pilus assembly protein PilF